MVRRGELTDAAWEQIAPLLPENGRRGKQWKDHRQVVNGIFWKIRAGAPWRDLPERYGPWQTCYDRFARWRRDGTWDRLLAHAQTKSDAVGHVEWEVSVDSTIVRAHQHAAGARRAQSREDSNRGISHPKDEALGRSRGGLSTKLHLACDGRGRPLSVVVTPGQRHKSTQLASVLDAIRVPHLWGAGRPRKRPQHLIADRGYSFPSCRSLLRGRGIPHTIPERCDQRERRANHIAPRVGSHVEARRPSRAVERCVNRLKQWRGVATRYEKRAISYRATVVIAALVIWLS